MAFAPTENTMERLSLLLVLLWVSSDVDADWLVQTDGQRTQVRGLQIAERAVHVITQTGARWSILRDAVDVVQTRAANGMSAGDLASPGWGSPVATPAPSLDIVPQEPVATPSRPPEPIGYSDSLPDTDYRFSVYVNGAVGARDLQFGETRSFELFKEQASVASDYMDPRRQGVELGGLLRIAGPLGVTGSIELLRNDRSATYSASLPHPFFFEQFRTLAGEESGLSHEQGALHLGVLVTEVFGPVSVDFFGGPSWFITRTELLVDVLYEEAFPYDTLEPLGTRVQLFESRPLGFNVGSALTYRFGSIFGVDFTLRYSQADAVIELGDGREVDVETGGFRFGAGLRLLFP